QAEDGIRDRNVTGVQTCALPILPLGGKCGEELGGDGRHGGCEGRGGVQQCVVEVEKHRLDGQLPTTDGTLRRRPFEPARTHSRSRRRRRRAMLELRPRISIDSNNGGETRRPVTPTRSGVKACRGLMPISSTSTARSAVCWESAEKSSRPESTSMARSNTSAASSRSLLVASSSSTRSSSG